MKMRIGNRLTTARNDRKLTQAEMAELLNVSPATYSRLERNDTSIELDKIVDFAKILEIPIQEFLPDTIAIHSNSHNNLNGHIGLVMGNMYNYADKDAQVQNLNNENEKLRLEISFLKQQNDNLQEIIRLLKGEK